MEEKSYKYPLTILTGLFFIWGFITCLNDMLIPYFKSVFELSNFQANLVQFAFFTAYFVISLIYFLVSRHIGDPIDKVGYKNAIIAGLLTSTAACLMFFEEAGSMDPSFPVFLCALFLLGTGFTFLQISANPLVSMLGTPETSSSRLNLSQGFNSLGTTIAPIVGSYVIFNFFNDEDPYRGGAQAVQIPYLALACILLFLAVTIFLSDIPDMRKTKQADEEGVSLDSDNSVSIYSETVASKKKSALEYPHLVFGMFAIFFYVGGEVAIGSNLVTYMKECVGIIQEFTAGRFLAFYWGGAMIGRFVGSLSMSDMENAKKYGLMVSVAVLGFGLIFSITGFHIEEILPFLGYLVANYFAFVAARSIPSRTLGIFATINIALLVAMLVFDGMLSLWCILAVGLFNSIMFSNVFTLAIRELGEHTAQGSSLLVMMILGGAVVPPLQGLLADNIGVHMAFALPIVCYVYLMWYGFKGCTIRK